MARVRAEAVRGRYQKGKAEAFEQLMREALVEGPEATYNTKVPKKTLGLRPYFWDLVSLLQVSLLDIKVCFPQGGTSTDLTQALFLASLAAFKSFVNGPSPKELLLEYDTLVDIFLTRFEYSTSVETEATSFHEKIYP